MNEMIDQIPDMIIGTLARIIRRERFMSRREIGNARRACKAAVRVLSDVKLRHPEKEKAIADALAFIERHPGKPRKKTLRPRLPKARAMTPDELTNFTEALEMVGRELNTRSQTILVAAIMYPGIPAGTPFQSVLNLVEKTMKLTVAEQGGNTAA